MLGQTTVIDGADTQQLNLDYPRPAISLRTVMRRRLDERNCDISAMIAVECVARLCADHSPHGERRGQLPRPPFPNVGRIRIAHRASASS